MNPHSFYRPILQHFRRGRMQRFAEVFKIDANTTVLDMGGSAFNWTMLAVRPKLTILDVYEHGDKAPWATYVVRDGCRTEFPDKAFDIVFSNSVIEHVGGIERQRKFAAECMRCGRSFFVQTPNKWFPVDTHTLMPFIHWLPQRIFKKLVRVSPRLLFFKHDRGDVEDFRNLHLLSASELQGLFPGAMIIKEKFLGMTKSLIAVSAAPYPCPREEAVQGESGRL